MSASLDDLSPEQYRARYQALRANAHARAAAPAATPRSDISDHLIIQREQIPSGWYQSFRLGRGEALRIINHSGTNQVAAQIWNALDTSERFNPGDTLKLQWTALLTTGRLLFSDMGRVLCSIIADSTDGRHDAISGVSSPASNFSRYGDQFLRNGRDNFRLAAAKLGLAKRDVHPAISFFARTQVAAGGNLQWLDGGAAEDFIDLRAEMDLFITLSNTPHPLAPGAYPADPVTVLLWQAPPPAADDPCRHSCAEAERGFENNSAFLRGL